MIYSLRFILYDLLSTIYDLWTDLAMTQMSLITWSCASYNLMVWMLGTQKVGLD